MAVKTAKLTGAEAAVTGLDGSIAHIRNDGAGVVLASLKAGLERRYFFHAAKPVRNGDCPHCGGHSRPCDVL